MPQDNPFLGTAQRLKGGMRGPFAFSAPAWPRCFGPANWRGRARYGFAQRAGLSPAADFFATAGSLRPPDH